MTIHDRRAGLTGRGAIAGVLAGGLAICVGWLIAGITGPDGSPVVAVGQLSIDFTPPAVKNFAISAFGTHDKLVLVSGILAVLAVIAAGIGVLAERRLRYGLAGLGAFAVVGMIAALTRPAGGAADILPSLIGAGAGALALTRLIRTTAPQAPPPRSAPAAPGTPQAAGQRSAAAAPGSSPPLPSGQAAPLLADPPARRKFLVAGATTAGVAVVSGFGGRMLAERSSVATARSSLRVPVPASSGPALPLGTDLKVRGLSPFVTSNSAFYRVDTAIVVPQIPPASWHLRVHGMVAREITLSFDQLIRRPLIEDYITLTCVSNPVAGPYVGNARWIGVSLASLLRAAGIRAGADELLCTSADGFTSGAPVQTVMDGRDAMLAVAMNGTALPVAHGFPVRMVVPGLYGYVSACKWITDIEVTTFASNVAYWSQRGWDQQAPIKTQSRIDVPSGSATIRPGKTAVAGVAWAQHKGIDAVEVRVDRGPWHQARLAAVPGIDTWRQWVWEWDAAPGSHIIEARATDATGYTQTAALSPPEPNGATGYPMTSVQVSR